MELGSQISFESSSMENEESRFDECSSFQCKQMVEDLPTTSNSFEWTSNAEKFQRQDNSINEILEPQPQRSDWSEIERDQAALKLQKVYKSFRTRRQLADFAVLVEQKWFNSCYLTYMWELLDFAELKRSSISFFDIEKPHSAISRWSRATTKAAKVGKGLSNDRKVRKFALQHWLEADLRKPNGFLYSAQRRRCTLLKNKGTFQHSSFLAGNATLSAGRLQVENGILKAVGLIAGTIFPLENFQEILMFLEEHNVDLTHVKKNPDEMGELELNRIEIRGTQSEILSTEHDHRQEITSPPVSTLSRKVHLKVTKLEIPRRQDVLEVLGHEEEAEAGNGFTTSRPQYSPESSTDDGYETAEDSFLTEEDFMVAKANLFDESQEHVEEDPVLKDKILMRINSQKGTRSYRFGNHLSSKWTTGAGPRIGCMRDYPQYRILEQANLSPRNKTLHPKVKTNSRFLSAASTPSGFSRETLISSSFTQNVVSSNAKVNKMYK